MVSSRSGRSVRLVGHGHDAAEQPGGVHPITEADRCGGMVSRMGERPPEAASGKSGRCLLRETDGDECESCC